MDTSDVYHGNFHNISFWIRMEIRFIRGTGDDHRLFNGDLLDFGRLPIITCYLLGVVVGLMRGAHNRLLRFLSFSFSGSCFYFRSHYLGGLIDLIPV